MFHVSAKMPESCADDGAIAVLFCVEIWAYERRWARRAGHADIRSRHDPERRLRVQRDTHRQRTCSLTKRVIRLLVVGRHAQRPNVPAETAAPSRSGAQ